MRRKAVDAEGTMDASLGDKRPGRRGSQGPPPRERSAGTGTRYVITVLGEIPPNITARLCAAHASAISAQRAMDLPDPAAWRRGKGGE